MPAKLGRGEVEAISLAKELGADKTLLDDRDAREAAKMRSLEVVGTLGILEEAAKRRLVDIEQTVEQLKRTTFRASETLYQSVLARVTEHLLAEEREPKRRGT